MLSHHQPGGAYSNVGPPALMGDFVMQVLFAILLVFCLQNLLVQIGLVDPDPGLLVTADPYPGFLMFFNHFFDE